MCHARDCLCRPCAIDRTTFAGGCSRKIAAPIAGLITGVAAYSQAAPSGSTNVPALVLLVIVAPVGAVLLISTLGYCGVALNGGVKYVVAATLSGGAVCGCV